MKAVSGTGRFKSGVRSFAEYTKPVSHCRVHRTVQNETLALPQWKIDRLAIAYAYEIALILGAKVVAAVLALSAFSPIRRLVARGLRLRLHTGQGLLWKANHSGRRMRFIHGGPVWRGTVFFQLTVPLQLTAVQLADAQLW